MTQPTVLSIDPGANTRGAIQEEAKKYGSLATNIVARIGVTPRLKDTLNTLTGIDASTMSGASSRIFFLRFIIGALLISGAVFSWLHGMSVLITASAATLGICLIFGFMTRLISLAALPGLAIMTWHGMIAPEFSVPMLLTALVFAVTGPGIFSTDQFIRRAAFRASRRRRIRRNVRNPKLDYRCYTRL